MLRGRFRGLDNPTLTGPGVAVTRGAYRGPAAIVSALLRLSDKASDRFPEWFHWPVAGRAVIALTAIGAGLAMAGCGGSADDQQTTTAPRIANVTEVNGKVPPGRPTAPDEARLIKASLRDGMQVRVYRSARPSGTRAAIHTHPYGGVSCVFAGEKTLYMEGSKPMVAKKGDCYWMPPGVAMTSVSTGPGKSVTIDYFTTPPGKDAWKVVEKGLGSLQSEFADSSPAP